MHKISNAPTTTAGPETTGRTLHWASPYDFWTSLLGFGVNSPNSRNIVELAGIKPGDKVLDVGCGSGNLTLTAERLAGPTGSVHGIDAAPEMIEVARKKAHRSGSAVIFDVGLIEKIPHPDNTFDVVISRLMVHHLPEELKPLAFREVLRVLKPGGSFFIADFNPPTNPVLSHLTLAMVGHGMMKTSVKGLPAMLTEAGFVQVATGPTRSGFLAFVSGRKPGA